MASFLSYLGSAYSAKFSKICRCYYTAYFLLMWLLLNVNLINAGFGNDDENGKFILSDFFLNLPF